MQGARAALWEAGLHSEKMAGTGKEVCEPSAVIGQRPAGVGPETDPQGIPAGSLGEGEACAGGRAAVDVAWEAWGRDAGWVMMEAGLGGREAEPES